MVVKARIIWSEELATHLVRAVVLSPEGRTYRSVGFNPRNLYLQIGQPIVAFVDPADPDDVWVDVYPTGRG